MHLFTTYLSENRERVVATIIFQIWALPLLVALYTFNEKTSQWVFRRSDARHWFPYVQVAWASRNSYSVRTRTHPYTTCLCRQEQDYLCMGPLL